MRQSLKLCCCGSIYFNPRTPYGMRHFFLVAFYLKPIISIHAPLTGCDETPFLHLEIKDGFQSTHPLRDATRSDIDVFITGINFNPRTPYGMRLHSLCVFVPQTVFQSTHPLRDATSANIADITVILNFNPRTPYGMRRYGNG